MNKEEYILRAVEAQSIYCAVKQMPEFAPGTGKCWRCGKNIYNPELDGHYDLNYAMTHLITGCPYCHSTYCD